MKKHLYSILASLSFVTLCWPLVPITVGKEKNEKFQFSILPNVYDGPARRFFVGANQEIENDEDKIFAVSCIGPESEFIGLTPEKVTLNGLKEQLNPLYGAKISQMDLFDRRPLLVTEKNPSSLYILEYFGVANNTIVTSVDDINDAEGNTTSGIVALSSNASGSFLSLPGGSDIFKNEINNDGYVIYAAVKKAGGCFGQKGSGIAVIAVYFNEVKQEGEAGKAQDAQSVGEQQEDQNISEQPEDQQAKNKETQQEGAKQEDGTEKKEKKYERVIKILDAQIVENKEDEKTSSDKVVLPIELESSEEKEAALSEEVNQIIDQPGNKAAALDGETAGVFIKNPAELFDAVTIFNSRNLGLYIGLQGRAGFGDKDGIRSVVLARVVAGEKLEFREIAPAAAFSSNDKIIGSIGAGNEVSCHFMTSMLTSTWLDYLVVVGGNGSADQTQDQVYALPIVGALNPKEIGVIAKKDSTPAILGSSVANSKFYYRSFIDPVKTAEDMPLATDSAACVGGGPLGLKITKVFTTTDTIFVSAGQAGNGQQAGIFYSQALFDELGRITQWTSWARAGAVNNIFGFAFDSLLANFILMSGPDENSVDTVTYTNFGKIKFSNYIEREFSQENGGVYGINEFPFDNQGFSDVPGRRLSVIAWPGNKKIILSQVGADDDNGNFGPIKLGQTFTSENGDLDGFVASADISNIAISGGDLNKIGPIISTALSVCLDNGYFVVGGFGGIAILANESGNGFDARQGLQSQFVGLDSSFSFKKLNYSGHVRKLISNDDVLYIVSDKNIMRTQLVPEEIEENKLTMVCLTDGLKLPSFGVGDTISDVVIANGFAVIATSAGVYFASDVDRVSSQEDLNWRRIAFSDGLRSSTRLLALGPKSGFDNKGMVLVLNAYVGLGQARIFRLVIDSSNKSNPVKNMSDVFLLNRPQTYFLNIGFYRNYFTTDGAATFVMRSKTAKNAVLFNHYSPLLRSSLSTGDRKDSRIEIDIKDATTIGPMVRSMTSGEWLIVGDFGVRGNG